MPDLPSGTVTFLFTDIEGSTRLWEAHPNAMRAALRDHDVLLRACIESHGGRVFKTVGDAFCAVFANPRGALESVLASQRWLPGPAFSIAEGSLPLKVRMALHTGVVAERDGDYFGQPLNRVARLLATGHGGQVLLSAATQELVRDNLPPGAELRSLGEHRLKDLGRPESIFQLLHPDLSADFPPLRSLDNPELKHNLPRHVTSFVGREVQIAEIQGLLEKTSLLTLTGSGGSGKTRLALQVAAELLDGSGEGVWLVELAPVTDPGLVPWTVANVLGLKEEPGKPILQTLTEHLRSKHLLLILDNCEHLLTSCAKLADVLLRSCPRVLMLATSREGLGISGERTYRVPSLSLPDPRQNATPEGLGQFEAVRLFIERADLVQTGFQVTNRNAPAVASICHRLDGIPLAIELAAARVRSLTVEDINGKLDQRFRLLTGGSRTALPRQQTLRSLIDWSYDLLSDAERALLSRLSVFLGGWNLDAAEAVCSGDPVEQWEVLDLLTSLCDKSLVVSETAGTSVRYRLLETVRQYARDRLMEGGGGATCRDRHLAHFLALAEESKPHLRRYAHAWLEQLETEHDNLRAGLEWGRDEPTSAVDGLRLAGALWRFWMLHGHLSEGRERLAGLLAGDMGQDAAVRAEALHGAGMLAGKQGDFTVGRALHEESLAIFRELGDRKGIAASLNGLGSTAHNQGDAEVALAHHKESLALQRELGDRWGVGASLNNLGFLAVWQGDYPAAKALFEEGLALCRELGFRGAFSLEGLGIVAHAQADYPAAQALLQESLALRREPGDRWGTAGSLNHLGRVACSSGDYQAARALLQESLAIRRGLGDQRGYLFSLGALASLALAVGAHRQAASLWGAAERLSEEIGVPLPPGERSSYEAQVVAARTAIGDEAAFDVAWAEGRALTLDQAIALALEAPDA